MRRQRRRDFLWNTITPLHQTNPKHLKTKFITIHYGTKRKIHKSKMLKMQRNSDYIWKSLNKSPMPRLQHSPSSTFRRKSKNPSQSRRSIVKINLQHISSHIHILIN